MSSAHTTPADPPVAIVAPTPAVADGPDPDLRSVPRKSAIRRWLGGTGTQVLLLDLLLLAVFTGLSRDGVFLSLGNLQAMAQTMSAGLLLALALGMLLSAGVIDLSVGSNLVLSSVIGGLVIQRFSGPGGTSEVLIACIAGFAACLVAGALFGLFNGLIIELLKVNSLIATLGTLGIGTGVALILTDGGDVSGLPVQLQQNFAFQTLLGLPLPAALALVTVSGLWATLRFTRFGMHTLAIGSSRAAAERAGVRVRRHVVTLVVVSGTLAGLAGFFSLATFGSTTIAGHNQDALNAITAAVIGGTAVLGGRINVIGIVWGALLAQLLQSGLVVIGVKPYYQLIAVGAVLVFAVAVDRWNSERSTTH